MKRIFFVLCGISFLVTSDVVAQCGNEGREFYAVFPPNEIVRKGQLKVSPLSLRLYLTTRERKTQVKVSYGLHGSLSQTVTVDPGMVTMVELPKDTCHFIISRVVDSAKAIHIESLDSTNIVVYGLSSREFTADAFTGIPVRQLGTRYRIASYNDETVFKRYSEVAVVATEDSTSVTFSIAGITPNPLTVTLNRGQSYLVNEAVGDMTGGLVTSDKPIAVFSGHECAFVPIKTKACDHLLEQLAPVLSWGNIFYMSPFAKRTKGDFYRIIADSDATSLYINGIAQGVLSAGSFFEGTITTPLEIVSSKPVQVVQYAKSINTDTSNTRTGDPFMMALPPATEFTEKFICSTLSDSDKYTSNWITIYAPKELGDHILFDGKKTDSVWTPIPHFRGVREYAVANIEIGKGKHIVSYDSTVPTKDRNTFLGCIYGWKKDGSYGYTGGLPSCKVLPQMSACANLDGLNGLLPGENGKIKISLKSSGDLSEMKSAQIKFSYDVDLLRFTGNVYSDVGTVANFTNDETKGECLFTFTGALKGASENIIVIEAEALLSTHADGAITVDSAKVALTGNDEITSSGCISNFQMDRSCINPSSLRKKASNTLSQNYPDPFINKTRISYSLGEEQDTKFSVYDVFGRLVETLVGGRQEKGNYSITLDGSKYPAGMYFYRLKAGRDVLQHSMILTK